ncbi:MAG: DUF541 domain-containing protein [Calditrichaeota bacterium]|nr:MAG: DUF541 domain-containing protein [Calditrichota bacterium]
MRVLRVEGRSEISGESDWVILSFEVNAESSNYAICMQTLDSRTYHLKKNIEQAGLDAEQVKTSDYDLRIKYRDVDGEDIFAGFFARHNLVIEFPMERELLSRVLGLIAGGQSSAEINIRFSVRDKEALRHQAMEEAVRTARDNAEALARAADIKLGPILQIDYGTFDVHIKEQSYNMLLEPSANYGAHFAPKKVTIGETVHLTYEIIPS